MRDTVLALTMGDPAGVGPEIIAAAWPELVQLERVRPIVVGHPQIMRQAFELRRVAGNVVAVDSVDNAVSRLDLIPCLWPVGQGELAVTPAKQSAAAGHAAYEAIVLATQLALAGKIDAITTGPINKASLHTAGHHYPGHTELLAELCGVRQFAMMLHLPRGERVTGRIGLNVVHVMLHTSMRNALTGLSTRGIVEAGELIQRFSQILLDQSNIVDQPRLGVCALNPHAGEQGAFGDEESTIIGPAIDALVKQGIHAQGPYPADTLMSRAAAGEFDGVVAMYHDQGHIAVKLLDMHRAVNITLGLPIVRTSVAHGTAFDLAWQGSARHEGLVRAAEIAVILSRSKYVSGNP